jgi:hypothetical protein
MVGNWKKWKQTSLNGMAFIKVWGIQTQDMQINTGIVTARPWEWHVTDTCTELRIFHLYRYRILLQWWQLGLYSLSLSFPVAPTLEHRTSVKRFVSLQFLNHRQSVEFLGREISPSQSCYLTQAQNKRRQTSCLESDSNPQSQCSSERRQFMS